MSEFTQTDAPTAGPVAQDVPVRASTMPSAAAWQRALSLTLLPALAAFCITLGDPSVFADGDSNWHVAVGRWILAHGVVPHIDPFSYTAGSRPWVAHEWLSETAFAAVQAIADWSGVVVLIGAACAATFAILANTLQRWLGVRAVLVTLAFSAWMLAAHLYIRPHMLALPLLALWMTQLLEARRLGRTPALWLLPLMTLWANLHGSFIFGLAFTAPFAAEAAVEAFAAAKGRSLLGRAQAAAPVALRWGGFMAAAVLAAAVNPNGVADLVFPFTVMRMTVLNAIAEWHPAGFGELTGFAVALFFTLFVCLHRGVRIGWARTALLLLLVFMTLQHRRQEIILAVVAPLLLAAPLARALNPARAAEAAAQSGPVARLPLKEVLAPGLVAAGLVLGAAVWRLSVPEPRRESPTTPITAVASVPAQLAARPVFNDYGFGGWLIFSGVRPFIDGRADLYGDDFVQTYLDTEEVKSPAQVDAVFNRYGVQWTILQPTSPLVAYLDHKSGWRRLYTDKWAVVQARTPTVSPATPGGLRTAP